MKGGAMPEIKRHGGTAVHGFIVGGGYEGRTKELDQIVQREAELLKATYNRDVQIRFNSDRLSGGAWLVNSLPGFSGCCQVGLCAGNREATGLYIDTVVDASALRDKSLATEGVRRDYSYKIHATVEDALAWLKANVDSSKLLG